MEWRRRALVVGAGPGGLAATIALRRVGIQAEVFERAPELREIGAGLGVQSNALKALQRIGVADALLPHGRVVEAQEFFTSTGRLLARAPMGQVAAGTGMPVINVSRSDLQRALLDSLDHGAIHTGRECTGVEPDDEGVTALFRDGTEERGAVLVGADGVRSVVRSDVIGDGEPSYTGFSSWRAIVTVDGEAHRTPGVRQYMGRGGVFSVFPMTQGRVYWGGMRPRPEGESDSAAGRKADVLAAFEGFPPLVSALVGATDEAAILRNDLYDRDPVPTWGSGRITLLGDAAHPTTPFMGQGAGIAMEDGVALAKDLALTRELADGHLIVPALRAYEQHRGPRTASIVLQSRRFGRMYSWSDPVRYRLRDAVFAVLPERVWRARLEETLSYEV